MYRELEHLSNVRIEASTLQQSYQKALTRTSKKQNQVDVHNLNLFKPEIFPEVGDVAELNDISESSQEDQRVIDRKETISSQQFINFVKALKQVGTIQQSLAINSLAQVDLSSIKLRNLLTSNQGIESLVKSISYMTPQRLSSNDRKMLVESEEQAVDPVDVLQILLLLCTLCENNRDNRKQLLREDIVRICLSLSKFQIINDQKLQVQIAAMSMRLLAACARDSAARMYMKRIQAYHVINKLLRQYSDQPDVLYGCGLALVNMFKSKRMAQIIANDQSLIMQLVQLITDFPKQPVSQILFTQAGGLRRASNKDSALEQIIKAIEQISTIQYGRTNLIQAQGLKYVCYLLKPEYSGEVVQKAVKIVANCARDRGVDALVRAANGLNDLVNLLGQDDYESKIAVCQTIVNICCIGPYQQDPATCNVDEKAEQNLLSFNQRNDDNIKQLVECQCIQKIQPLICCDTQVLYSENGTNVVKKVTTQDGQIDVVSGQEERELCLEATRALSVLLCANSGKKILDSQAQIAEALVAHLMCTDVAVLLATLECIYYAFPQDKFLLKQEQQQSSQSASRRKNNIKKSLIEQQIDQQDGLKRMFALVKHSDLRVAAAAAKALNRVLREENRCLSVSRGLGGEFQLLAELVNKKYDDLQKSKYLKTLTQTQLLQIKTGQIETNEVDWPSAYTETLRIEVKSWLCGLCALLARDQEAARIFSELKVSQTAIELLQLHPEITYAYQYYVDLLKKEKAADCLAALVGSLDGGSVAADSGVAIELVSNLQRQNGEPYIIQNNYMTQTQQLCTQLTQRPDSEPEHQFGSLANFRDQLRIEQYDVETEALQTSYVFQNSVRATVKAILNCCKFSRKCCLQFRQYGAQFGLLTLVGSTDEQTARASADALKLIRETHIQTLEVYKRRQQSEQRVDPQEVEETVRIISVDQNSAQNTQRSFVQNFYQMQQENNGKNTQPAEKKISVSNQEFINRTMRQEQQSSVFISGANVGSVLNNEIAPTLRKQKKAVVDDGKDQHFQVNDQKQQRRQSSEGK